MEERRKLKYTKLKQLLAENVFPEIRKPYGFREASEIVRKSVNSENIPEAFEVNPLTKEIVIFSPRRSKRKSEGCPICIGDTTSIIFHEKLPSGEYAFVNSNLYPCIVPDGIPRLGNSKETRKGCHFLIWPTTEHKDNIRERTLKRLEI